MKRLSLNLLLIFLVLVSGFACTDLEENLVGEAGPGAVSKYIPDSPRNRS